MVSGFDRQITGISDQPANGTSVINLNKFNTELNKKADVGVVMNGLSANLDITFNTNIAKKTRFNAVMLRNGFSIYDW